MLAQAGASLWGAAEGVARLGAHSGPVKAEGRGWLPSLERRGLRLSLGTEVDVVSPDVSLERAKEGVGEWLLAGDGRVRGEEPVVERVSGRVERVQQRGGRDGLAVHTGWFYEAEEDELEPKY